MRRADERKRLLKFKEGHTIYRRACDGDADHQRYHGLRGVFGACLRTY